MPHGSRPGRARRAIHPLRVPLPAGGSLLDPPHPPFVTSTAVGPAFVATHHARFRRLALDELAAADPAARVTPLAADTVLVEPDPARGESLDETFAAYPPVFVEHLAPVTVATGLAGTAADVDHLAATLPRHLAWNAGQRLVVECRKSPHTAGGAHAEASYSCRDVEIAVGVALEAGGATIDLDAPTATAHVYLTHARALAGVGVHTRTLRARAQLLGRGEATAVSRAEHKLAEAMEVFGWQPPAGARAVDLGAAPGGWSLLLARRGVHVTAVDPARLAPDVAAHPLVTHVQARAEHVDWSGHGLDLVANDMAADPDVSAAVMATVAGSVPAGGTAVMTVKLPTLNVGRWLPKAEAALGPYWRVQGARHLAANRQEITWLLARTGQRFR